MKFYRYEWVNYSSYSMELRLMEYDLIKETPKGYWIGEKGFKGGYRWVSKTGKKRYAYPTADAALINYIKRTERRISILTSQLNNSKNSLIIANNRYKKEYENNQG